MKSGLKVRVEGYANDGGGIVTVRDERLGEENLSWERIAEIEFLPVPAGGDPGVTRLRGANDVDEDNRGVMVEDPRYGRVTIPWKEFDKVTFSDPAGSGPGYRDYPAGPAGDTGITSARRPGRPRDPRPAPGRPAPRRRAGRPP